MSIKVKVTGVGGSVEVEAEEPSTVSDILAQAGYDAEAQGLNVKANGAPVSSDETVNDGDQVTATPRTAKLG